MSDALHPDGRCVCSGNGTCEWCLVHCRGCGCRVDDIPPPKGYRYTKLVIYECHHCRPSMGAVFDELLASARLNGALAGDEIALRGLFESAWDAGYWRALETTKRR